MNKIEAQKLLDEYVVRVKDSFTTFVGNPLCQKQTEEKVLDFVAGALEHYDVKIPNEKRAATFTPKQFIGPVRVSCTNEL